jgi:flagellar M-ring protein FliF
MADALPPPALLERLPPRLAGPLIQLRDNAPLRRRLLPALIASGLMLAGLLWLVFAPAERTPAFRNLPESDKAAVVDALEGAGFDVALDARTGAVMLPPSDHARARMLLAGQGLPRAAPGALDLIGEVPLGTSRAVEGARLRLAAERELARSIESMEGVEQARVIVALPEPSPFVRERSAPKASVSVTLARGRTLSAEETRAIAHLVAGAVPGLSPDAVAIADQTGRLLAGGPGSAAEGAMARRLDHQARLEARARESILALLAPLVGPDKVTAQVAIELEEASREAATERFQPETVLRSEAVSQSSTTEPRAIGIPGALTNTLPAAPQVTAEAPTGSQPTSTSTQNQSATRNYEVGRSVEVMASNGGSVRRMTAAVVLSADALGPAGSRAATLAQMKQLVEGAIGADPRRGDRVTVVARPFVPPADLSVPVWREPLVIEGAKWLAAALVALGILVLVIRPLVVRYLAEREAATPASDTAAAALPRPAPRLVDYSDKLAEARRIAATDAARATAVARRLLAEAEGQG